MKLIVAIIQPEKLDYVTSALRRASIPGATVTKIRGFGDENAESDWDLSGVLTDKIKVEVVLADEICDQIINMIEQVVGSGEARSGFIYVQDVLASFKVRDLSAD